MRELLPGTWEAENNTIKIYNPDGTVDILFTCWAATRQKIIDDERWAHQALLAQRLQEKRDREPEAKGGRGK